MRSAVPSYRKLSADANASGDSDDIALLSQPG